MPKKNPQVKLHLKKQVTGKLIKMILRKYYNKLWTYWYHGVISDQNKTEFLHSLEILVINVHALFLPPIA